MIEYYIFMAFKLKYFFQEFIDKKSWWLETCLFSHFKLFALKYFFSIRVAYILENTENFCRLVFFHNFFTDLILCYVLSPMLYFNHLRQILYSILLNNSPYHWTINAAHTAKSWVHYALSKYLLIVLIIVSWNMLKVISSCQ